MKEKVRRGKDEKVNGQGEEGCPGPNTGQSSDGRVVPSINTLLADGSLSVTSPHIEHAVKLFCV